MGANAEPGSCSKTLREEAIAETFDTEVQKTTWHKKGGKTTTTGNDKNRQLTEPDSEQLELRMGIL